MADQQDATSADVDTSATEDGDAHAEELLADVVNDGDGDDESNDQDDDRPLGPKGERALQAEKERRRAADRARRATARERDEALAELDRLKKAAEQQTKTGDGELGKDAAPDLEAIREEAREKAKSEAKAEVLKDRVSDKIEVLAARRFQDAGDAVVHLLRTSDIADYLDGDKIDAEAIREALDELLEKKPYLAVAQGDGKRFKGSGDGGAKPSKPARPQSLGEAVTRHYAK